MHRSIEEASEMNHFRFSHAAIVPVAMFSVMLLGTFAGDAHAAPYAELGSAVAACDFNHDGFTDLAVGAPFEDVGNASAAGVVHVLYGTRNGVSETEEVWNLGTSGVGEAAGTDDRFGEVLAAGDFDGDGFCDLVIGAAHKDVGDAGEAGVVVVLQGGPNGLTAT